MGAVVARRTAVQWRQSNFFGGGGRNFTPHRDWDESLAQRAETRGPKGCEQGMGFLGRGQRAPPHQLE